MYFDYIILLFLPLVRCTISSYNSIPEIDDDVEVFPVNGTNRLIGADKANIVKIESVFVKTKIRYRYARTRVTSKLHNPHQSLSQNCSFTLRMPNEALITRFEMRVDNELKIYRAEVVKAEDARKRFEFAITEGRTVTLGFIERIDLESQDVILKFVVGAKRRILFSLIYEERIARKDDHYESVIYLVPEYTTKSINLRVEVVIEENLPLTWIKVPLDEEYSNQNASVKRTSDTKAIITWSNYNYRESWDYPRKEFTVSYALQKEEATGHILIRNGYFVHFFAPSDLQPVNRHVIFVLDVSDSMMGQKMNQTASALTGILEELPDDNYFSIIAFSSNTRAWSCFTNNSQYVPSPATSQCKDKASSWFSSILPEGSTNIYAALVKALEFAHTASNDPVAISPAGATLPVYTESLIIFLTDGQPTSGVIGKEDILFEVRRLNSIMSVPIFPLAFGNLVDFSFLTKLSYENGGFARKIYEEADPSVQLQDFYKEISSSLMTNLAFHYVYDDHSEEILIPGKQSNGLITSGEPLAFKGREILTLGHLNVSTTPGRNKTLIGLNITGDTRNGSVVYKVPVKNCATDKQLCKDETDFDDKCIEKLFVYLTIQRLTLQLFTLEVESMKQEEDYANSSQARLEELKEKVTNLALKHQIITPYTTMVMRTKSIAEEEMGIEPQSSTKTEESHEESGNEIILGSKPIIVPLQNATTKVKTLSHEVDALREKGKDIPNPPTRIDFPLKFIENHFKVLGIGNAGIDEPRINNTDSYESQEESLKLPSTSVNITLLKLFEDMVASNF